MPSLSVHESLEEKDQAPHFLPKRYALPVACSRFIVTVLSAVSLALATLAMDRSLTTHEYYYEEVLMIVAPCILLLVVQLQLVLCAVSGPSKLRKVFIGLGTLAVAFVWASWIITVIRVGRAEGTCKGPAMSGRFDNLRACRRLEAGTIVTAINAFVGIVLLALQVVQK